MSNPRRILGAVALLAIVPLLAPACSQKTATGGAASSGGGGSAGGGVPGGPPAGGGLELSVSVPGLGAKIVKTATVSLQLPRGSFAARVQQARAVAARNGGFVADSRTAEGDLRSGSLVIRVPAAAFDMTLGQLEGLGTVKDERIAGQDVTARFVDLQARLQNWQAQERVLLRLMAQSKSITDSLKVQGQLQDVQLQIEEIDGQLRVLNDQTAMATITLNVAEAAAGSTSTATFASAWRWALRALHASITGVVVAVGFVLPFALIALLCAMAWVGVRRIRARPTPRPGVEG